MVAKHEKRDSDLFIDLEVVFVELNFIKKVVLDLRVSLRFLHCLRMNSLR